MSSELTTYEVGGTTIFESPRGDNYHLIYDNDGLILLLYFGDFSVSTSKNLVCSPNVVDIQDAIDSNVLFFDDRSEIAEDCRTTFFAE